MSEWVANYENLAWWFLAISLVSLLISLLIIPYLLLNLPIDYLLNPNQPLTPSSINRRLRRWPILWLKNAAGALFILAGILMLVLPGQGVLTIVAGLLVMEFPGKNRVERWLIGQRIIFRMINWVRRRADKAELIYPSKH